MRTKEISSSEAYVSTLYSEENELKRTSRKKAEGLGLGGISLSPIEAQLLKTLLILHGCKKFVEIGTLTGLSAQYIFEALPQGGALWTLEKDLRHAEAAKEIFSEIDQSAKKIHLVLGDARVELKGISNQGPFDGIFIDGNKAAYMDYLDWALMNLRSGGLIIADNIFLSGAVWGATTVQKFSKSQIEVMRAFNKKITESEFLISAVVPTAEGFFIAIKK